MNEVTHNSSEELTQTTNTHSQIASSSQSKKIMTLVGIFLIGIGGGYMIGINRQRPVLQSHIVSLVPITPIINTGISPTLLTMTPVSSVSAGKIYTSARGGIGLYYPATWFISESTIDQGRETAITVSAEARGHTGDGSDRTVIIRISADDGTTHHLPGHTYTSTTIGNHLCELDDFAGRGGLGFGNRYAQCVVGGKFYSFVFFTHNEDYSVLNTIIASVQFTQE